MGHYIFRLPDIGEGVAEAEIVAWHVRLGDRLDEDQALVDVMTDKATVEMTTPVAGRVVALHGKIGERVPVGSSLVELDVDQEVAAEAPAPEPLPSAKPLAAPATRQRARDAGVALEDVSGTGPAGRITAADLDTHLAGRTETRDDGRGVTEVTLTGLRRQIAERMEATLRIPHFSYVEEFDLTELEALRQDLNAERGDRQKLTLLPFFMRALARLVPDFPSVNAHYDDEAGILRTYASLHIGIATRTEGGLKVPVVRHAETRGLWDLAAELARVSAAARDGTATRADLTGSTITLTSLGALGGLATTPVINRPEVAIIGPNRLVERPVVLKGQVAIRTMMNVSASFDHRIIDGYDAARFIQGLKRLVERPALLFMADPA